jgi:hypothetical protein
MPGMTPACADSRRQILDAFTRRLVFATLLLYLRPRPRLNFLILRF